MDIDIDRSSALSLRVSLARPSLIEPSTAAGKHCGTCTGAWHGVRAVRMTKECYKKRQACRASAVQRSGADPERDAVRCGARQLARSHLFGAVWQQRNVQRLSKRAGRRPEWRRLMQASATRCSAEGRRECDRCSAARGARGAARTCGTVWQRAAVPAQATAT